MPTNPTTEIAAEMTGRISPSKSSFSVGGGAASIDFIVPRSGMGRLIQQTLGSSEITAQGSLRRELPAAHPYYDWLYATKISNIEGVSLDGMADAAQYQRIIQTHFKDLAIYENYKVTVEFEPRPYIIMTDEQVRALWQENVPNYYNVANSFTNFTDCAEYRRFVEISIEPNAEFLTTAVNSFKYKDSDTTIDGQWINGTNGSGVNIVVVKPVVKLTWYFVPYLMVFSQNITDALGKVNQYQFYGYQAGSLLFKGMEINKYSPPFQTVAQGQFASPETTRMCDITFVFELFQQSTNDLSSGIPVVSGYKVAYGHNLVISARDLKYYYAEIAPERLGAGRPVYGSYRMEKLFRYN